MIPISADLEPLRSRFFTAFDPADKQVLWMGKPTTNPDESQPYCRLVIEPGEQGKVEQGAKNSYLRIGLITFTVTIPKGIGLAVGYDMRDKFAALYRDWVSPDRAIVMGNLADTLIEEDTCIKLRVRVRWQSFRSE